MLASLLILLAMPILDLGRFRGVQHRPISKFILVTLAVAFIVLLQLGALHVEAPFITLGQIVSVYYFAWFLLLFPFGALIDNSFGDSLISITKSNNIRSGVKLRREYSTQVTPYANSFIVHGSLGQGHPFHLVDSSPWPLSTSLVLGSFAASLIMTFADCTNASLLLIVSTIVLISNMSLWFSDIIAEGGLNGDHTSSVVKMLTNGMVLFIITEIMFFFFIFWGYLHSSLSPAVEIGSLFPPLGIEPLDAAAIPTFNTILLLSSGAAVTWSHHALLAGNRNNAIYGAIFTILLAILFTYLQAFEYYSATFTMADSIYGNIFFLGTGAHGLHVVMGTIMIAVATIRIVLYHATSQHHVGFEAAILYWHFVDVVWLVLYLLFYWWGS
jgi:cytochrome c oxidase subunit 3